MLKKHSQTLLILICFLAYALNYLTRYSYNANVVEVMSYYGVSKADAGLVNTLFFIAYGVGQFIHGAFCRHYPKKYVIPGVLLLSSALNLVVFFKPPFFLYKYFWLANGFLLSVLWPSLIDSLSLHLDAAHLKKAIFSMSLTTSLGTCAIYGIAAIWSALKNFQYTFLTSAILGVLMAFLWFFCYDSATTYVVETAMPTSEPGQKKAKRPFRIGLVVILLAFFSLICNLIRDGMTTWVPAILKESFGFGEGLSIALTILLPVLGVFGVSFALFLQKKVKDYSALDGVQYALLALFLGLICFSLHFAWLVPMLFGFGFACLLAHGINSTCTSIAPMQMRDRYDSGKLAGIINGCGYIGSALSSYGLGLLVDHTSWDFCFYLLTGLSFLCVVIAFLFFFLRRSKKAA